MKRSYPVYTLIINLSLRSMRTVIFDDKGTKIFEDWLPIRTYINGMTVEQDPEEWWNLLLLLLKKVFSMKDEGAHIRYISVTSSAMCLVCLDKENTVLRKAIMVSDKRANKESKEIKNTFSEYFSQSLPFKAEPSFMIPKILWLKRNEKNIFKKTAKYLSAGDFLLYRLTGEYSTDILNAEKFYYLRDKKEYPKDILSFIGVVPKQLPEVVIPGTKIGKISLSLRKYLGIKSDIEVFITTYDAICAFIGGNTYTEKELHNVCGTCSSYRIFVKEEILTQTNLLKQFLPGENLHIIGASNNLEGGVLEWAKECFYGDNFLKDDDFLYTLMQTEAQESELGANGIIFLPYLLGERVPFTDNNVRGTFMGIERFHTRKDIIRSIFEGVAFQAKYMLEEFEKNKLAISSITMSGGVSKMPFAAQLRADVLGLPIHVTSEVETTALGTFIMTLIARKKIKKLQDAGHFVTIKQRYLPNMHNHNCYASLFILYKKLYNDNKEMFERRKQILSEITHYRKKVLEVL